MKQTAFNSFYKPALEIMSAEMNDIERVHIQNAQLVHY